MNNPEKPNSPSSEIGDIQTSEVIQNGRRISIDYKVLRKNVDSEGKTSISLEKVHGSEKDLGPVEENVQEKVIDLNEFKEQRDKAA